MGCGSSNSIVTHDLRDDSLQNPSEASSSKTRTTPISCDPSLKSVQLDSGNSPVESVQLDSGNSPVESVQLDSGKSPSKNVQLDSDKYPVESVQLDSDKSPAKSIQLDSDKSPVKSVQLDSNRPSTGDATSRRISLEEKTHPSSVHYRDGTDLVDSPITSLDSLQRALHNSKADQVSPHTCIKNRNPLVGWGSGSNNNITKQGIPETLESSASGQDETLDLSECRGSESQLEGLPSLHPAGDTRQTFILSVYQEALQSQGERGLETGTRELMPTGRENISFDQDNLIQITSKPYRVHRSLSSEHERADSEFDQDRQVTMGLTNTQRDFSDVQSSHGAALVQEPPVLVIGHSLSQCYRIQELQLKLGFIKEITVPEAEIDSP